MQEASFCSPNCPRFAAKKRGAFRSDYLSTVTKVISENKTFGFHLPPHVFLGAVCAQHGHLVSKISNYSRG
jgi:hypothetical protein